MKSTISNPPKPKNRPKPSWDTLLKNIADDDPSLSVIASSEKKEQEEDDKFNAILESVTSSPQDMFINNNEPELGSSEVRAIEKIIKTAVESHWNVPVGAKDADKMVIPITIELQATGAVQSVKIESYSDPNTRTMAESAQRAVLKASPLTGLRPFADRHKHWKRITLNFRPPL